MLQLKRDKSPQKDGRRKLVPQLESCFPSLGMDGITVDFKFIAFWVIWIIGVGIFGWLISQPRKKKEDK